MRKLRNAILEEMAHLIRIGAIEPVKVNAEQITNRVMAHVECASSPEREFGGQWISTKDRLPEKPGLSDYEQIDCLVIHKGERRHLVWNCEHMVWDDSSGDDWVCNPLDVDYWMPFPDMPDHPRRG